MNNIKELSEKEWERSVEKATKPVVVLFYSPTCAYCHAMEPSFAQYAEEYKDQVIFAKCNIMHNQTISARYGVMGTPTFKFFCHGKPVQELVGQIYPPLIKKTLDFVLKDGENCVKKSSHIDYGISPYA